MKDGGNEVNREKKKRDKEKIYYDCQHVNGETRESRRNWDEKGRKKGKGDWKKGKRMLEGRLKRGEREQKLHLWLEA